MTNPGASNGESHSRGRGRRFGTARELFATGRAYAGPLLAIALITLVVCTGLVGGQRELDARTTSAFQDYLRQHATSSAITATSTMTEGTSADLTQASADVRKLLPAPAGAYHDDGWTFSIPASISNLPTWLPSENPETSRTLHQLPSGFELVTDSRLLAGSSSALRFTAGKAPTCNGTCTGIDVAHALPIAISEESATSLRIGVGTQFLLTSPVNAQIHVVISGLFRAAGTASADPADPLNRLLHPEQHLSLDKMAAVGPVPWTQWQARALVATDGIGVATAWMPANLTWAYSVVPHGLAAGDAQPFAARIRALVSAANTINVAGDSRPGRLSTSPVFAAAAVVSSIPDTVAGFESDATAAHALGLFVLIAAAVVGIATIQLALRVLFARQESDLALRRARGLGPAAAARRAALQTAACVVPAAAIGMCAAVLAVRGGNDRLVVGVGIAVVIVLPLAAAVTAFLPAHRQGPISRRRRALRRTGAVLLLLFLGAAVAAVRTQLSDASDPDLVSASLPTLAATVGALLVGALVALLARPAAWIATGRTRAAALFLAAAHAARRPALPAGAAVALLVATSSAVFASCFTASLDSVRQLTAWQQTGADLRVQVTGDGSQIDPTDEARIAAAAGVRAGATGAIFPGQQLSTKQGVLPVTVVIVDPAEYAKLVAGTRLDSGDLQAALHSLAGAKASGGAVSALISDNLSTLIHQSDGDSVGVENIGTPIAPVAHLGSFPAISGVSTFLVLPRDQVESVVHLNPVPITDAWFDLNGGHTEAITRAQAIPGVTVIARAQRAAGLDSGPIGQIAHWTSRAAIIFDLALAVVCLLLAGTLTARTRAAGRTFLATLGARRSTGVAATVLETLPAFVMIGVIAFGAAFGALALLAPLIGRMAVGNPHSLPLSGLATPATAILAVFGIPALGLLLAAVRAATEHRTRLSFLREERD
ncbi:MAG TPA: hypothetical protein VFU65_13640 [Actinocrinis sp.]|nr:hypothetical protein [Actinocrinis sp.]